MERSCRSHGSELEVIALHCVLLLQAASQVGIVYILPVVSVRSPVPQLAPFCQGQRNNCQRKRWQSWPWIGRATKRRRRDGSAQRSDSN